jgi:hypothetical protein
VSDHTEARVGSLPSCDLCAAGWTWPGDPEGGSVGRQRPAYADAKTTLGPWAFVCREHFDADGLGLGLGLGQRLIVRE